MPTVENAVAPASATTEFRGYGSRLALRLAGTTAASIHHDLHLVAHLDLRVRFQAVEDAEALRGAVDAGHAVGERFHGVAGLHGDDLEAQGPGGLHFFKGQATEGVDGLA